MSSHPTAVVFFRVVALDADGSPFATACIDPATTKVIQTGTEQALAPTDWALRYFGASALIAASPTFARLVDYLSATLRSEASRFGLRLSVLVQSSAAGAGKTTLVRSAAAQVGMHVFEVDAYDLVGDTDVKTEGTIRARFEQATSCAPCVLLLRHIEALARKTQAIEGGQDPPMAHLLQDLFDASKRSWRQSGYPLVVVGTSSHVEKLPASVLGCFKTELTIEAPSEAERASILQTLLADDAVAPDVSLRGLAVQTAALVAKDLVDLCARARATAWQRVVRCRPCVPSALI